MLFLIIFWSIISFIFIFTLHNLFNFFTDTLTVPKVKDLIYEPKKMYSEIETTLKSNNLEKNTEKKEYTQNYSVNSEDMKSELKSFFNDLKNEKLANSTTKWDTVYSPSNF